MDTAFVGAVGVVVGAVVTGTIQVITVLVSRQSERRRDRRRERVEVYKEALWEVKKFPRVFQAFLLTENEAMNAGEEFELPDLDQLLGGVERAIFELRLLGTKRIADEVQAYATAFTDWLMGQDAEAPISGFDALKIQLDVVEARVIELMRKDLS